MADVNLPAESQRRLIEIARQTLEGVIRRRLDRNLATNDPYLESVNYGAFVTLFNQEELRGCIGTCDPPIPGAVQRRLHAFEVVA